MRVRSIGAIEQLQQIRAIADDLLHLSDAALAETSATLSHQARTSELVDHPNVLLPAAALMTEAIRRVAGIRLHDVQLRGGLVIASGRIAEMQTGEGKTLVAAVGAFLQSLTGRGVHVSTTNTYLARRDFEAVAPMLRLLGVSVGLLEDNVTVAASRAAYECDVTYGTGYQFGFDYLRDQLALNERAQRPIGHSVVEAIHGVHVPPRSLRQRGFAMAIVDEADSVLIDEALVPLIISGAVRGDESAAAYHLANQLAGRLIEAEDYEVESRTEAISLTRSGRAKAHACLQERFLPSLVRPWTKYVENALLARHRFDRDRHYVVREGEVQIVDQNTGRIFSDRTWRDGVHQAVEAKEGVEVRPSEQSSSRITRQRFFKLYDRLAGLTGTIIDSADEIRFFYGLEVVQILTNVPCVRWQLPSRYFATADAKLDAIAASVREFHDRSQPVLVGTTTIDQSRKLSQLLKSRGIPHRVLNGMQDEDEAEIISKAGVAGSVLVATNMAGRGTDIRPCPTAISLGGLHVIAAQHALSPRIDRQLIGRSARQGNPGSCQYFASAEDELIAKYAPSLGKRLVAAANESGECERDFSQEVARLQRRIDTIYFDRRKQSVQSDVWFDQVRETLH